MQIDWAYFQYFSHLDIESIKNSPDTIYIIDPQFRLRAFNQAWTTFAIENDGIELLSQFQLGDPIDKAFPDVLLKHYCAAYRHALNTHTVFDQDYECSSPTKFRLYHQTAYPLLNGKGLVISNHLVKESNITDYPSAFDHRYLDQFCIVTQCSYCRKIKDPLSENLWVWVPYAVENTIPNTSHAICPRCLDFYFPIGD